MKTNKKIYSTEHMARLHMKDSLEYIAIVGGNYKECYEMKLKTCLFSFLNEEQLKDQRRLNRILELNVINRKK